MYRIMMDDPALPEPLYARMVKDKEGDAYSLYWERSKNGGAMRSDAVATPEV